MEEVKMEEQKKKRGRPPKKKPPIEVNESVDSIKMKSNVSVSDVTNRLKSLYGTMYSNGITAMDFKTALNRQPMQLSMMLNNPYVQNQRLKTSNSRTVLRSKKEIQQALNDPGSNEKALQETSAALYYNNYVYQNLVKLYRDVPQYFYYTIPLGIDEKDLDKDDFKKEKLFLDNFLSKFDIAETFKNVSLQTGREGKCSYVFRDSYDKNKGIVDFALLQKLPPQYVKYTAFGSESPVVVSFDFSMFLDPTYSVSQWPEWFGEIWNQLQESGVVNIDKSNNGGYKINPTINPGKGMPDYLFEVINGTYYLYVEMPQSLVYTFGTDFGDVLSVPDYAGLFADLSELEAYKVLQSQTLLTNITNILTAEVPIEKDASAGSDGAILSPEVVLGLEGDCSSSLSGNILPFFAPLENFKMHSVEHIPNAVDIALNATRNVISSAGVSGLVNTSEKPSIAMIKGEQYLHEARMEYQTLQYQKFINMIIEKFLDMKYRFKVVIWGGVYTFRDEVKVLKEMVQSGNIGMFPRLLSAYRMTIEDYAIQYKYVKTFDLFPGFESQNNGSGSSNKDGNNISTNIGTTGNIVGRPEIDDDQIEDDNTAASKEGGQNVSENK